MPLAARAVGPKIRSDAACSPIPDTHRHVTPAAFAEACGYGRAWGYKLLREGELPSVRLGGRVRIRYEDALDWIEREAKK